METTAPLYAVVPKIEGEILPVEGKGTKSSFNDTEFLTVSHSACVASPPGVPPHIEAAARHALYPYMMEGTVTTREPHEPVAVASFTGNDLVGVKAVDSTFSDTHMTVAHEGIPHDATVMYSDEKGHLNFKFAIPQTQFDKSLVSHAVAAADELHELPTTGSLYVKENGAAHTFIKAQQGKFDQKVAVKPPKDGKDTVKVTGISRDELLEHATNVITSTPSSNIVLVGAESGRWKTHLAPHEAIDGSTPVPVQIVQTHARLHRTTGAIVSQSHTRMDKHKKTTGATSDDDSSSDDDNDDDKSSSESENDEKWCEKCDMCPCGCNKSSTSGTGRSKKSKHRKHK